MYDHVVKCQRAGLCLSEHFLISIAANSEVEIQDNDNVQSLTEALALAGCIRSSSARKSIVV